MQKDYYLSNTTQLPGFSKNIFLNFYNIIQALSLDVVSGICILSFAIGKYDGITFSWHTLLGLSIAIWLIYTADHLLDAKKIKGEASTFRHSFHKKHRKILLMISVILFLVGLLNMFYLPHVILYSGLLLGFITGVYFLLLQKHFFWVKELCVAFIYTIGVFIGPVALSFRILDFTQWMLIPQVFFIAFANLLIFSWFDKVKDKHDGHNSMVLHWGKSRTEQVLKIILATGILSCLTMIAFKHDTPTIIMQVTILMMYIVLAFIFRFYRIFRQNDFFRIAGDGIFYFLLIYIIYAN